METFSHKNVCRILDEATRRTQTIALLKTGGCGISKTLISFTNHRKRQKNTFYLVPSRNSVKRSAVEILYQLGYDFRPRYTFEGVRLEFLINAIKYHFTKVKKDNLPIVIIDDSHFIKGKEFSNLAHLLRELNSICSFALVSTKRRLQEIQSKEDQNEASRDFIDMISGYSNILKPHREERCAMCYQFGIRDQRLIDLLVNESANLKILIRHFERIWKQSN